jgi:antirestriction protein ArdC
MTTTAKPDLYQEVTNTIIKALENGAAPWVCPWKKAKTSGIIPTRSNGQPYQGVNVVLLWAAQQERGYSSNQWFTLKQASALGARVRKGETASHVVFTDAIQTIKQDKSGNDTDVSIPFLKRYCVFNAQQIDGLPVNEDQAAQEALSQTQQTQRIDALDTFFASSGALVRHGGNRAFYAPSLDSIAMPDFHQFPVAEHYYGTLAHELTHWTGHETRCNREFSKRFGDAQYAAEELVAEIGAAFLCAGLGIEPKTMDNHVNYLAHWLELLKDDKRAIFTAASAAQKAANFIHSLAAHHEPLAMAA